jgi:hypothetical protein
VASIGLKLPCGCFLISNPWKLSLDNYKKLVTAFRHPAAHVALGGTVALIGGAYRLQIRRLT